MYVMKLLTCNEKIFNCFTGNNNNNIEPKTDHGKSIYLLIPVIMILTQSNLWDIMNY